MQINILDSSLINKISAGEVIERPANVIKELLENSIDAKADEIKIEIEDAGLKKIKVSDNGLGMEREDMLICYRRHTTSKIKKEKDLNSIKSLGFRGEALASISEISNIKIKTRPKEHSVGNFLEVEGGIPLAKERIGCSSGTIIEITNLFYNVPARKKFLKSTEVELAHIIDIVTRYALIKKEISISLIHNKKVIINSQKTDNQFNNIISIYGTEVAKNLIEVDYSSNDISIKGYISRPNLTRANKNEQSLYVNDRYVKCPQITDAIYSAYKTFLFTNRHPIFILNLKTNPESIDVNVHPNKLEIRLKNEQEICEAFFIAVKQALSKETLIPSVSIEDKKEKTNQQEYSFSKQKQSNLFKENNSYEIQNKTAKVEDKQFTLLEKKHSFLEEYNILGQINKTFIVLETKTGITLIDQHAAEERVNYEILLNQLKDNAVKKQKLIHPIVLQLNPNQFQTAINQKNFIEKMGFEFEDFSANSIKLSSIPQIFNKLKINLFTDLINELSKINTSIITEEIEKRIIRFACRQSIKAGDQLSNTQINELINKLKQTKNPYSCPHGRPTIIQITVSELEKKFKRTGW